MTPRGTRGLFCVHIAQLMTHRLFKHYHLPCFMLQALRIPQRIRKSQKVYISSHDGFQNFKTPTFLHIIGPIVSQSEDRVAGISSFPHEILNLSSNRSIIL